MKRWGLSGSTASLCGPKCPPIWLMGFIDSHQNKLSCMLKIHVFIVWIFPDNSLRENHAFLLWGHLGTSPKLYKGSVNFLGRQRSYTGDDKWPRSQERKKCGLGQWEKKQHWQASEEEGTGKQEDVREPNSEKEQTRNQKLWSKSPSCTLSRPQKAAVVFDLGTVFP